MRLQFTSDLHLEYLGGIAGLRPVWQVAPDVDGLILAGDIGTVRQFDEIFSFFCAMYNKVIYVPGNHEFWRMGHEEVEAALLTQEKKRTNLVILRNSLYDFEGLRLFGGTLWFPQQSRNKDNSWIDFANSKEPERFIPYVWEQHKLFRERLVANEPDVVISHHLPLESLISRRFRRPGFAENNCYFATDLSREINEIEPLAWVFGHTHDTMMGTVGETLFAANPFGYPGEDRNGTWSPRAVLVVDGKDVFVENWKGKSLP